MTALTLNGVGHAFFGRTVLSRVSLSIRRGEVVALVGPSGCVRADLCSSRSVRKIIIGMIIGHAFNRPTQANLLTLDRPMKARGSAAVDLQMLALGTLEVGEEHQTAG